MKMELVRPSTSKQRSLRTVCHTSSISIVPATHRIQSPLTIPHDASDSVSVSSVQCRVRLANNYPSEHIL